VIFGEVGAVEEALKSVNQTLQNVLNYTPCAVTVT